MEKEPYVTLLDEMLEAWQDVRRGLLDEAGAVPDDEYDFRPDPGSRSVAELLRHVLESASIAVGELTRADGDFTRQPWSEHVAEHAGDLPERPDPEELRELLARGFAEGVSRLRAEGELHMLQYVRRFDGLRGTRMAWFHHHIAHEMYHRGQLALYVRLRGGVPALTRRIEGG